MCNVPYIEKTEKQEKKMLGKKWIQRRQQYGNFLRMSASQVETIIQFTGDIISKKDTKMRPAIAVEDGVVATLRF